MIPSNISKALNMFFVGGSLLSGLVALSLAGDQSLLALFDSLVLGEPAITIPASIPLAILLGAIIDSIADMFRHYREAPTKLEKAKLFLLQEEAKALEQVKETAKQLLIRDHPWIDENLFYEVTIGRFFNEASSDAIAWSLRQFTLSLLMSDFVVVNLVLAVSVPFISGISCTQGVILILAFLLFAAVLARASLRLYFVAYRGAYRGLVALYAREQDR